MIFFHSISDITSRYTSVPRAQWLKNTKETGGRRVVQFHSAARQKGQTVLINILQHKSARHIRCVTNNKL